MSCKPGFFNGWGDCAVALKDTIGGTLQYKGNTWTDANAQSAAAWQTAIADDDKTVRNMLVLPIESFVPTTDEMEVLTSALGKKSKGKNSIPSGIAYLKASLCDYKQLLALEGKWFEYQPHFDGGSLWMTRKTDLNLKGFRCQIAMQVGFVPDDKTQSFPVYLFFDNYSEFENVVIVKPTFEFSDLFDYSPVGLDVVITTAYTAGVVVVRVTKRGSGDAQTGLDQVTDWETMVVSFGTTLPAAVTVVVENGQGSYTLTIKKDTGGTPANLASSDTITLQAHDDDATNLTYISHVFDVVGGA